MPHLNGLFPHNHDYLVASEQIAPADDALDAVSVKRAVLIGLSGNRTFIR